MLKQYAIHFLNQTNLLQCFLNHIFHLKLSMIAHMLLSQNNLRAQLLLSTIVVVETLYTNSSLIFSLNFTHFECIKDTALALQKVIPYV